MSDPESATESHEIRCAECNTLLAEDSTTHSLDEGLTIRTDDLR